MPLSPGLKAFFAKMNSRTGAVAIGTGAAAGLAGAAVYQRRRVRRNRPYGVAEWERRAAASEADPARQKYNHMNTYADPTKSAEYKLGTAHAVRTKAGQAGNNVDNAISQLERERPRFFGKKKHAETLAFLQQRRTRIRQHQDDAASAIKKYGPGVARAEERKSLARMSPESRREYLEEKAAERQAEMRAQRFERKHGRRPTFDEEVAMIEQDLDRIQNRRNRGKKNLPDFQNKKLLKRMFSDPTKEERAAELAYSRRIAKERKRVRRAKQ